MILYYVPNAPVDMLYMFGLIYINHVVLTHGQSKVPSMSKQLGSQRKQRPLHEFHQRGHPKHLVLRLLSSDLVFQPIPVSDDPAIAPAIKHGRYDARMCGVAHGVTCGDVVQGQQVARDA